MLKKLKQVTLRSLKTTGVSALVQDSRWRRQRLLILAYHAISMLDEHEWNGSQCISSEVLQSRMQQLQRSRCAVLPLGEAIERLYANDLPDRAVALTFDDGFADFYHRAFPIISDFGFPVTLYLTTFYSYYNRPVFDVICSYLLWRGRSHTLATRDFTGSEVRVNLATNDAREAVLKQITEFAAQQNLSAAEKDARAAALAAHLGVDYDELLKLRILHNVTPAEARELSQQGVDIQLHTHRHRTPLDRSLFTRELDDNRSCIKEITGKDATHFCYPSGVYARRFLPWLTAAGIKSATTCNVGFASRASDPLLLPRFLDNNTMAPIEFESWLTGVSLALPRRPSPVHTFAGEHL
ncbi:MAG TPA: polysaccharide deacetylase family protein [Pyrinomonadaceae bacterium]|nr:polysaccharide deacetylase family protein [Pyrinomonadaceae bacterium]